MKDITRYHLVAGAASTDIGIIVFLTFVALKLCGKLALTWLWVTSPVWLPVLVTSLLVSFDLLFAGKDERSKN